MKLKLWLGIIAAVILMVGCTPKQQGENAPFIQEITYSNLTDTASKDEVRQALQKAGITSERVEAFLSNVEEFNTTVENTTLNEGFTTTKELLPEYDVVSMQEKWENKKQDFLGYNCRLTTFHLLNDFVDVGNPIVDNDKDLFLDKDTIEQKKGYFNEEQELKFRSFFSHIPTEKTKDMATHLKTVQENWKKKEIQFKNQEKASFISVIFHFVEEDESNLFIGHMGVLLPTEDGKLLFLEKLSFLEPYQALRFENRTQLNDYLMNRYDISWNQPTADPFIMENGELMEGFRPNLNKQVQG